MSLLLPARRFVLKGGIASLAATATGLLHPRSARAADACGGLSREDFETYISIFSENDRDDYAQFYTEDVLYERGQNHTMQGIQAVVDFYREVHEHLTQRLTVVNYAATATFIGAEVHSEFTIFKDFKHESGLDFKAGEHFIGHNFVHYGLRGTRISHIKSASFRRIA
jgi:hypothetical protein